MCETSKRKMKKKMDCIVDVRMMCGRIKGACSWNEMLDDRAGLHRSGSEWRGRNEGGWWGWGGVVGLEELVLPSRRPPPPLLLHWRL